MKIRSISSLLGLIMPSKTLNSNRVNTYLFKILPVGLTYILCVAIKQQQFYSDKNEKKQLYLLY